MCESRAVPSGKVYRQLLDAQVQLSRSLQAGRRETRTDCLSAEDSNTQCSATSRLLCPFPNRGQQVDGADEGAAVSQLPDFVVVDRSSSDIIEQLTKKRSKKHEEALKQLDAELTEIAEVYETQVKTVSEKLQRSQQDVNLSLDTLKDRMKSLEYWKHASQEDVYSVWEEVEKAVKEKKIITELKQKLIEAESKRTDQIRAVLRKYCSLLEKISYLPSSDVHRLIHNEATVLNQSLLANRRSVARLLLLLHEENLQQQSLLRLHWEDCLSRWKSNRVKEVTNKYRDICCSIEDQQPAPIQQLVQRMKQTQHYLTEKLCEVINNICSLVPPSCSISLVSDWFSQLEDVNKQIYSLHADYLHELGCCYEQTRQDRLSVVECCKEELLAVELTEEEVDEVVCSKLLHLIGQRQTLDEKQLAACGVRCESVHDHAVSLSRCVFHVMRGAAVLWERHSSRLKKTEDELKQQLDNLRDSQQQSIQKKMVHLDVLLGGLRQEGDEDSLKISLDKVVIHLQEVKESCRRCVSDQCRLVDRQPPLLLEELFSFSTSLSSFFHLNHTYRPNFKELQKLHPAFTTSTEQVFRGQTETELTKSSKEWLSEAESALKGLCDDRNDITFTSSRGVSYTGPAFACPGPDLLDPQQEETHLTVFPVELLRHTLNRMRTLFVDNLEQYFHDALNSGVSMVTLRKEMLHCELELQLLQLNCKHIETDIYQPRLAELQQHRQNVDVFLEELNDMLASCRMELQDLQTSTDKKNKEFTTTLSNMEDKILTAGSSQCLEAVSSALQSFQDQHIKDTQHCQTTFRQTVQKRLKEVRLKVTQLHNSLRLFSEGGDYAPCEVKLFQSRLKGATKKITEAEESIYLELEQFESKSLQQVKEASGHYEKKISLVKSEVMFMEKINKLISSTQMNIKAEAATNNQQQASISNRLEHLRKMLKSTQVTSDQVCSFLSFVTEELKKRCQYLDFSLDNVMDESLLACSKSRKQVHSAPGLLQPRREGAVLLSDPAIDIIKSLNRFSMTQDGAAKTTDREEGRRATSGQSSVHVQQRCGGFVGNRRSSRSERRLDFGPKPDPDQTMMSFSSAVNAVLWKANEAILQVAEDFYRSKYGSRFFSVPDNLDQWAEGVQQRLLGYQEQARKLLSTSREELVNQFLALMELLQLIPKILIGTHEQQQEAEFRNDVGAARTKLMETLATSEKEKRENARQLQISHRDDHLQTLSSREECRQQQIHSNICSSYQSLQECVRIRGEEFVTSLASLTETLLHLLDNLFTFADPQAAALFQHTEGSTASMETGEEPLTADRTFSGIPYLMTPADNTAGPPSNAITSTTASFTTTRCTSLHVAVIELRDAAVKRFEQLLKSESSSSDEKKERELRKLQQWSDQWKQQIDSLTHPGSC